MSGQFIGGCVVLYICSSLAAAAGIGGGALNVPILLAVFGYDYDVAVVLSLCAVLGNVLAQVIVNFYKRHPLEPRRPLIYWDMAMLLLPAQLGGNALGTLLGNILPTTAMEILAVCVTSFATYMTYLKGCHVYHVETEAMEQLEKEKAGAGAGGHGTDNNNNDVENVMHNNHNGSGANGGDAKLASAVTSPPSGSSTSSNSPLVSGHHTAGTTTGAPVDISNAAGGAVVPRGSTTELQMSSRTSSTISSGSIRSRTSNSNRPGGDPATAALGRHSQPTVVVLEQVDAATGKQVAVQVASVADEDEEDADSKKTSAHSHQMPVVEEVTSDELDRLSMDREYQEHQIERQQQQQQQNSMVGRLMGRSSAGSAPGSARNTDNVNGSKLTMTQVSNTGAASPGDLSAPLTKRASSSSPTPAGGASSSEEPPMRLPLQQIFVLSCALLFFVAIKSAMTVENTCSVGYWSTLAVSFPVMVVIITYTVSVVANKQLQFPACVLKGDVVISKGGGADGGAFSMDMYFKPAVAFVIGIACSLLGIGGGELMGPFLLSMKIIPQVSSATTSTMSFVSSLYNIVSRIIANDIDYPPAAAVFFVGMAAGVTGRLSALRLARLLGRPSVLIFILVAILGASCTILLVETATSDADFAVTSACS